MHHSGFTTDFPPGKFWLGGVKYVWSCGSTVMAFDTARTPYRSDLNLLHRNINPPGKLSTACTPWRSASRLVDTHMAHAVRATTGCVLRVRFRNALIVTGVKGFARLVDWRVFACRIASNITFTCGVFTFGSMAIKVRAYEYAVDGFIINCQIRNNTNGRRLAAVNWTRIRAFRCVCPLDTLVTLMAWRCMESRSLLHSSRRMTSSCFVSLRRPTGRLADSLRRPTGRLADSLRRPTGRLADSLRRPAGRLAERFSRTVPPRGP